MSSMDFHETWTLTLVQQRHDPPPIDVPVPETLEELRQSLGVDSGVPLLVSHRLHPDQQFVAERVDHLYDGATVHVHVPGDAFAVDDRHLFNGCLLTGCLRWIFFRRELSMVGVDKDSNLSCAVCAQVCPFLCPLPCVCVPCKLDPAVV